jgi:hypothetical protein
MKYLKPIVCVCVCVGLGDQLTIMLLPNVKKGEQSVPCFKESDQSY